MPEDGFKPFDILSQFAPHNVIANLTSGGQFSAQAPSVDVGGDGPKKAPPKATPAGPGARTPGAGVGPGIPSTPPPAKTEEEKKNGVAFTAVSVGPVVAGPSVTAGPGPEEYKIPQTTIFKVIDKETKLGVPDAAIYYNGTALGITDYKGELKTQALPKGKRMISVDAMFYDLYEMEVYTTPPSARAITRTYNIELSYLAGPPTTVPPTEPPTEPYYPPTEPYYPPSEPYYPPTTYQPPPTYEAPVYEAPSYGAPGYGGPSYGPPAYEAPGYQPPTTAPQLPTPPLPPIEYLQQLLVMPFTTLQTIFMATPPPPAPTPMSIGGDTMLDDRTEIIPAEKAYAYRKG